MQQINAKRVQDLTRLGGKVIYWDLCKGLKFDYSTKLYMNKPESDLGNETPEIFWNFLIQTYHLIPARKTHLGLIKKWICCRLDFAVPLDCRGKIEENDKYLDLDRRTAKKTNQNMEDDGDGVSNCIWCDKTDPKKPGDATGGIENQRQYRNHQDYSITEIGLNTVKRLEDWSKFAVDQTPMKDLQLTFL